MSRSIGDFECKRYGVIPDPEVQKFMVNPAVGDADGDLFVIVASDGVWEFIETQVQPYEYAYTRGAMDVRMCLHSVMGAHALRRPCAHGNNGHGASPVRLAGLS